MKKAYLNAPVRAKSRLEHLSVHVPAEFDDDAEREQGGVQLDEGDEREVAAEETHRRDVRQDEIREIAQNETDQAEPEEALETAATEDERQDREQHHRHPIQCAGPERGE